MNRFEDYLLQVFRGTYLLPRERRAWMEEMSSHLEESFVVQVAAGSPEDDAADHAIEMFGTARDIRQRVIRETFLVSPQWFLATAFFSFACLVLAFYTTMRFNDVIITPGNPSSWKVVPNPLLVVFLHHYLPLDQNVWAALITIALMMIFTRTSQDRLAVLTSVIPFCVPMVLSMASADLGNRIRHYLSVRAVSLQSNNSASVEILLILVVSLSLYAWTKNRQVSLTPWSIALAIETWRFLSHAVQSALWEITHNPVFWGQNPLQWADVWHVSWTILILIMSGGVSWSLHAWIDAIQTRRMRAV